MTTDDSGSRVTPFFFRQPGVNAVFDIDIVEIGEGPTGLPQSVTADLRRADADRDVALGLSRSCYGTNQRIRFVITRKIDVVSWLARHGNFLSVSFVTTTHPQ